MRQSLRLPPPSPLPLIGASAWSADPFACCGSGSAIQLGPPLGFSDPKSALSDDEETFVGTSVSGTKCGVRLEMGGRIGLAGHW